MPVEADLAVLDLAGRQQGVVGAEQLAALGLGRHAVAHKLAGGWLRRVHRGIYLTDLSLNEQFSPYPRHRGTAALKEAHRIALALTRSEAERRALDLIRAARLPEPEVNARVGPWELDLLWRKDRVVVEIDGYAFHSSRRSFERDRRKDRDLQAAGYRVLRFTWRELTEEPEAVVAAITRALAERR
jgi:very-short-patch-repair endonuclease